MMEPSIDHSAVVVTPSLSFTFFHSPSPLRPPVRPPACLSARLLVRLVLGSVIRSLFHDSSTSVRDRAIFVRPAPPSLKDFRPGFAP